MSGLFRNDPSSPEGKYPVLLRRDGTRPEWEYFVLGARDPASVLALRAYADECQRRGLDPVYVSDVRSMAASWKVEQAGEAIMRIEPDGRPLPKPADPDGPRHRKDDPDVLTFPGTLAAFVARIKAEAIREALDALDHAVDDDNPIKDGLEMADHIESAIIACLEKYTAGEVIQKTGGSA